MLIILLVISASLRAGAVPTGPLTGPFLVHAVVDAVVFARANPTERTLYEIVRSCLFTVAACVYRAIHSNIPNPALSFWGRLAVRLRTTICALVAPELIILWAIKQNFGASKIANDVNEINPGLQWIQTHGHFLQMGGFVKRNETRDVLYPEDFTKLLKDGRLDIEELKEVKAEDINDKSKGDILSKSVVAFQTMWFVVECIARRWQKLFLTELEVVTLAFAVLNWLTYALWWHKPLDVLRPISLRILPPPLPAAPSGTSSELSPSSRSVAQTPAGPRVSEKETLSHQASTVDAISHGQVGVASETGTSQTLQLTLQETIAECEKRINDEKRWYRWILLPWLIQQVWFLALTISLPVAEILYGFNPRRNARNVSMLFAVGLPPKTTLRSLIASGVIGMTFGTIHFLSWHTLFPTHIGLLLWRICSLILVGQPLVMMVQCSLSFFRDAENLNSRLLILLYNVCYFISLCGAFVYIAARKPRDLRP